MFLLTKFMYSISQSRLGERYGKREEQAGIFLANHNVVPNVDKVKYMSIALHHIQHCQSNNTKAK